MSLHLSHRFIVIWAVLLGSTILTAFMWWSQLIADPLYPGSDQEKATFLQTNADIIRQVTKYCEAHKHKPHYSAHPSALLGRLLVSESLRLVFCPVPKAASTSWKTFLADVSSAQSHLVKAKSPDIEPRSTTDIDKHETIGWRYNEFDYLRRRGIKRLGECGDSGAVTRILHDYVKLLVVREPLERLLSTYRDKMLVDTWYRPHMRPYIIDRYRHNITNTSVAKYVAMYKGKEDDSAQNFLPPFVANSSYKVTAREYLMYALDVVDSSSASQHQGAPPQDMHVMTITDLCQLCLVNYDYIVKFENMDEQLEEIYTVLGLGVGRKFAKADFPRRNNTTGLRTNSDHRSDAFFLEESTASVKEQQGLLERLKNSYSADIEMFGYG